MAYRILVAEDDGDIVQVLKLYLNNEGYEVLHAPNGAEALEIMEQQPADLCIFDIMMPRMDGYELIRRVRDYRFIGEARRCGSDCGSEHRCRRLSGKTIQPFGSGGPGALGAAAMLRVR